MNPLASIRLTTYENLRYPYNGIIFARAISSTTKIEKSLLIAFVGVAIVSI